MVTEARAVKMAFDLRAADYRIYFKNPTPQNADVELEGDNLIIHGFPIPKELLADRVGAMGFQLRSGYYISLYAELNENDEECLDVRKVPGSAGAVDRVLIPIRIVEKRILYSVGEN